MIVAEIGRVLRGAFLIVALGFLALIAQPALSLDDITVSGVTGKRVKLYSSDSDRKAVERVSPSEIIGSRVTGHTSRRLQIEYNGKSYWVDAYKVKTSSPLDLKDLPVGCDDSSTRLAMTSDSHGYSTARGSGQGCN